MRQVTYLDQPAHSIIGASKSHQWFECPGSVGLTSQIREEAVASGEPVEGESSVYAKEGTAAHDLAARCLQDGADAWEHQGQEIEVEGDRFSVSQEMVEGVQVYLDHVRELAAERIRRKTDRMMTEEQSNLAEVSPYAYGTVDNAIVSRFQLDVTDFKYGKGLVVEVPWNPQLMMYAAMILLNLPREEQRDIGELHLYVVQPRAPHPDGPVRSWRVAIPEFRRWLNGTLIPKMRAALQPHAELNMGDWCRYCPALPRCPLQNKALGDVRFENRPTEIPDDEIGQALDQLEAQAFYHRAIKSEVFGRLLHGREIEGWKLVEGKSNRVWREGAEEAAKDLWPSGESYRSAFRSPAQFNELGPKGKEFAAEWAHKPTAPDALAPDKDPRPANKATTADDAFAAVPTTEKENTP